MTSLIGEENMIYHFRVGLEQRNIYVKKGGEVVRSPQDKKKKRESLSHSD
jgi:hypothetical protein